MAQSRALSSVGLCRAHAPGKRHALHPRTRPQVRALLRLLAAVENFPLLADDNVPLGTGIVAGSPCGAA